MECDYCGARKTGHVYRRLPETLLWTCRDECRKALAEYWARRYDNDMTHDPDRFVPYFRRTIAEQRRHWQENVRNEPVDCNNNNRALHG
jgi:hypothetical protein